MRIPDPTRRRLVALLVAGGAIGVAPLWRRVGAGTSSADGEAAPARSSALTAPSATRSKATVPTVAQSEPIPVICRQAWRAVEPREGLVPHRVERVTVHHTAVLLEDPRLAPEQLRGHQRFHLDKGWPDLAYHFMIDPLGTVYRGRPVEARGDTATEYDPTGHLLVCCQGDFDPQSPTALQVSRLADVVAWAVTDLGVDPSTVGGHRDHAATSCPGDNLYAHIVDGSLARAVAHRADSGGVELVEVCGAEARAVVDAVEAGEA